MRMTQEPACQPGWREGRYQGRETFQLHWDGTLGSHRLRASPEQPSPHTRGIFYSLVNSCRRRSHPDSGEPGSETLERSSRSSTKPWESAATAPAAKTRGKGPQDLQRGLRGAGGGASMTPSYPRRDRHPGVGGHVGEGDLHSPPATRSGILNLTSHPAPSRLTSGNARKRDRKSRP